MKFNFKKILLMIFITFICFYANTKVYAEDLWCYYLGEDLAIHFNHRIDEGRTSIDGTIGTVYFVNLGGINQGKDAWVNSVIKSKKESKVCKVPAYYKGGAKEADKATSCPEYIIARHCNEDESYVVRDLNNICSSNGETLNFQRFKEKLQARDSSCIVAWGKNVSKETYVGEIGEINIEFNDEELECKCSEENPDNCLITPEIQDMIDEILMYPRIIVPIILIVTGIYNFAKAAFANKEDEMKKYQKKFFKQLLIGVLVFLVPTLINIIIDLSQYVWDGLKTCSI